MIQPVVRFEGDSFFELREGIVDLVEHHHTVSSIRIILGLLVIEPDGSTEIIHGFLVVADGHESITSISMKLGVSGALVAGRSTL